MAGFLKDIPSSMDLYDLIDDQRKKDGEFPSLEKMLSRPELSKFKESNQLKIALRKALEAKKRSASRGGGGGKFGPVGVKAEKSDRLFREKGEFDG